LLTTFLVGLLHSSVAVGQTTPACHVLCAPEFNVEPTITFTNLFGSARMVDEHGTTTREPRETEFEVILSLGLPTRASWLAFTVEAIFLPFDRESTPELELETNFIWLSGERTGGWLSSHFDIVDKFSPARRPTDRRAYTHKLNFELDTSVAVFNWLPEGSGCVGWSWKGRWTTWRLVCRRRGIVSMAVAFSTEPPPGRSPSLWSSRSPPFSNLEQSDAAFVLRLLMRWTGESLVKDWDGDIRRQQSSESPMIQPWRSRLHSDVDHHHVREDHSEQAFFFVA